MEIYKSEKKIENKEKFNLTVIVVVQDDAEISDEQKESIRQLREVLYDIEEIALKQ